MRGRERGAELRWGKDVREGRKELREGKIATLYCCASVWPLLMGRMGPAQLSDVRYSSSLR